MRDQKDGLKPVVGTSAETAEDNKKARLARRGAEFAFNQLSSKFGPSLLDVIPNMWCSMAGGLLSAFQNGGLNQLICYRYALRVCVEQVRSRNRMLS